LQGAKAISSDMFFGKPEKEEEDENSSYFMGRISLNSNKLIYD